MATPSPCQNCGQNHILHIHTRIKIGTPIKVKANTGKLVITSIRISTLLPNRPITGDSKIGNNPTGVAANPAHVAVVTQIRLQY